MGDVGVKRTISWISSSNCIGQFLMVSGRMKGPSRANSFCHLRKGYSKYSLPYCDFVLYLVIVLYDVSFYGSTFSLYFFPWKGVQSFSFFISYLFIVWQLNLSFFPISALKSCLFCSPALRPAILLSPLFQTELNLKWLLVVIAPHLRNWKLLCCGDPKGIYMHNDIFRCTKLVFKAN